MRTTPLSGLLCCWQRPRWGRLHLPHRRAPRNERVAPRSRRWRPPSGWGALAGTPAEGLEHAIRRRSWTHLGGPPAPFAAAHAALRASRRPFVWIPGSHYLAVSSRRRRRTQRRSTPNRFLLRRRRLQTLATLVHRPRAARARQRGLPNRAAPSHRCAMPDSWRNRFAAQPIPTPDAAIFGHGACHAARGGLGPAETGGN